MTRGRKPKPEAVRQQLAPVRSKRKAVEPQAPAPSIVMVGGAAPPDWLTGEGLSIWNERAPLLAQAKLLTEADVMAFARYCRNFARWLKNVKILDEEGDTYESESAHGKLKRANPAFLIADRLERQLLAAEDRFGLNPAERQRIMAARMNTGSTGDLFPAAKREDDPAAKPTAPAKPVPTITPVGFLQ